MKPPGDDESMNAFVRISIRFTTKTRFQTRPPLAGKGMKNPRNLHGALGEKDACCTVLSGSPLPVFSWANAQPIRMARLGESQ
jgi:hypothetical protein